MASLPVLLWLTACSGGPDVGVTIPGGGGADGLAWQEIGTVGSLGGPLVQTDTRLVAVIDGAIWESPDGANWVDVGASGLPAGQLPFLAAMPGRPDVLLVWVDGHGLYRTEGGGWSPVASPPDSALLRSLNPRVAPVPFALAGSLDHPDTAFLAATGGLYRSDDAGSSWAAVDLSAAGFNLLYTGVAAQGDTVVATALRPAGVLPDAFSDLLTVSVVGSQDGGATWQDLDPDGLLRWPAAVALDDDGQALVATMDQGLWQQQGDSWVSLGGPGDAVAVAWSQGGAVVGSARRGVWRRDGNDWTATGTDEAVAGMTAGHALGHDGTFWSMRSGQGSAAPPAGGATVHVALSMHVNLLHSYRGDSNDDDGYGIDLDVMRRSLDWLDEQPQLHADWDFDNAWSTDSSWMTVDGADVLARIQARVADGTDDVRLMSWNNGAMSAHTRTEFDESIRRAWDSNLAAFDSVVPGVQPQENIFTPEHIGWYADQGIEWITLFNSATPFSALRSEISLPREAWTNPSIISTTGSGSSDTADAGAQLTLVPVYHHGDLLDHGGLAGWVNQLHQVETADQLLVIHFDADAESWQAFDQELAPLLELDHVEFTTIQDYLADHPPALQVDTPLDIADGNGDGLQSWAGKDFNHEIATGVVQSRELAAGARSLAPDDDAVTALLDDALTPRLMALSTTHYGLAAPTLHPDRMDSARQAVDQAITGAAQALELALEAVTVDAGEVLLVNTRDSAGSALVELTLPLADGADADAIVIVDEEGQALPTVIQAQHEGEVDVALVVELAAAQSRRLGWSFDGPGNHEGLDINALSTTQPPPFTECAGVQAQAVATAQGHTNIGDRGLSARRDDLWTLPFCDDSGTATLSHRVIGGMPGLLLHVDAVMGTPSSPDDAESVVLSPLACDGDAQQLRWQTFGGAVLERPVRQGVRSWNGQAIDGWLALTCADGTVIQLSHRALERTSLGIAPIRTSTDDAVLAPLGTLWGPAPIADARLTGGLGMAWHGSEAIGSQFRPQAPDWSGQTVQYSLLIGDGSIDEGTLDLFAHPPLVLVGAALP